MQELLVLRNMSTLYSKIKALLITLTPGGRTTATAVDNYITYFCCYLKHARGELRLFMH